MITTVTKDNFAQEVLDADKPVLVDFWAAWCTPCRMLSPVVDEVAAEREDIKVCKINIDEEGEPCHTARRHEHTYAHRL